MIELMSLIRNNKESLRLGRDLNKEPPEVVIMIENGTGGVSSFSANAIDFIRAVKSIYPDLNISI